MTLRLVAFTCLFFTSWAHASQQVAVPDELKGWVPWVLEGQESANCPFQYTDGKRHHCAWPEVLMLDLHQQGGSFNQHWIVYEKSLITLPGNLKHWPQEVTVDGKPVVVSNKRGLPHIELHKGRYQLAGRFLWNSLPNAISLPKNSGLVDVVIDNRKITFPRIEASGRLWLNQASTQATDAVEDRLQVAVFRRVIDEVPLRMVTLLELNVTGKPREVVLGPLLSDKAVPLSISGKLPIRLESNGTLRLQVRPGRWLVEVKARYKTAVDHLSLTPSNLPDIETWVFDARPSLRLVEIAGVPSIDPRQTRLPDEWQNLPAYRVTKHDTMKIITKRRGDPVSTANILRLNRNLWLDFAGDGYTFQDQINGQMRSEWRLNMSPEMSLGRAVVNGVDQLVTRLSEGGAQGVEVRQGNISLQVDGRYSGDITTLPAVGWLSDFSQVEATLHLPPGWRLFAASGADSVGGASWLDRWTLLDIFLVLIGALAILRLFGGVWGAIALGCFILSWHESGAPQFIWLLVIAATALVRVAPEGRLHKSMLIIRYLSLLGLAVITIPYLIDTVRTAIYPQLEQPTVAAYQPATKVMQAPHRLESDEMLPEMAFSSGIEMASSMAKSYPAKISSPVAPSSRYSDSVDPQAKIQTGSGLPDWRWSSVPVRWNGPVQRGQELGLTLISPAVTSSIKLLSVLLVLLLGLRLAGISLKGQRLAVETAKLGIVGMLVISPLSMMPSQAVAGEIPPPAILKELQSRLLAPAECLPQCAQISRMKLDLQPEQMRILLEVHASEAVAIPVPSKIDGWMPTQVMLDGQTDQALRGPQNALWVYVPKGRHQIQITGPIRSVRTVQLPLPLQPRQIEVTANGWRVDGVHQDGSIEKSLQIEREVAENASEKTKVLVQTVLPPFVTVTRILRLGLEWQLETQVKRVSPPGSTIALEIPLLAGESVITDGIRVTEGRAVIQFSAQQQVVRWRSLLPLSDSISLKATDTLNWVEQWHLDVSPTWHVELSGIPQIHHQSSSGSWYPQWHPWPGEVLTIKVSKPAGIEGQTKTIDQTQLLVMPGQRATDVSLSMRLRSSQAEQHLIQLPEGVVLNAVKINGTSQPIRQGEDGMVRLPLTPGEQQIVLDWQEATGISTLLTTPAVDVGMASVNANIEVRIPESRWILFLFGPQMGPGVLFWGVLIVVVVIAIGLGRTRQTPLKTHQWLLLGIGLSQTIIGVAMLVVGWLFAMGWRKRLGASLKPKNFNAMQVGLGLLTLLAMVGLIGAVGFGLLGHPDMQISGNNSHAMTLKWYADQSTRQLPTATVISAPMWLYRALMLAWSLWLAFALLGWLKWAWQCFLSDGFWQQIPSRKKPIRSKKEQDGSQNDPWTDKKLTQKIEDDNQHKGE